MATATPTTSRPPAPPTTTPIPVSHRVQSLKLSATIAFMNRAKSMQRQGIDVLSFAAGEPDFQTPPRIRAAAAKALEAGQTKYTPTFGDPDTRAVIARKLITENGIPTSPGGEQIAISPGGKGALFVAMHCLFDGTGVKEIDQGPDSALRTPRSALQECLLPVPGWVSYAPLVEIAGGKVVELPTSADNGFKITPDQLRRAINPRTRLFIINSPCNPCGTMYTPDELKALAAVIADCAKTTAPNLVVISDELYEKIVYGGIPHFSIGSVPEIAERTLTVNGLSKAYAMTGWRTGYLGACGDFGTRFIAAMQGYQSQITTNITSFVYPAIREALTSCADDVEQMRQAFAGRAQAMYRRTSKLFPTQRPTGAFYVFPDVSSCFNKTTRGGKRLTTPMDLCEALLEESHIALVPGEEFGGIGKNHVRISFACREEQIEKGMDRFEEFLGALK
jgi:aspartate aminotransferase